MAEPTTAPPPAAPAAVKGKGGKKKIIVFALLGVLLLGGGAGAYFVVRRPAAAGDKPAHKAATSSGVVTFEPFVVNLADAEGSRFLRISVRLIVEEQEQAEKIQKSEVLLTRLRSAILELLTQQTSDKLVTADGKAALKKAIAERAAGILESVTVSDVLFADFVVQF